MKQWLGKNTRFADLFNAVFFHGRPVIAPCLLQDTDSEQSLVYTGKNDRIHAVQRRHDISKVWKDNVILSILSCEVQDKIHYAMPVRCLLQDAMMYSEQTKKVAAEHRNVNRTVKSEQISSGARRAEFLSGFKKTDRLCPVITLVLYYDTVPWDGPKSLHDMLDFPSYTSKDNSDFSDKRDFLSFVPDYRLNLLDVNNMNGLHFTRSDLQIIFDMLKYRQNKSELKNFIDRNAHFFSCIDEDSFYAASAMLHSRNFLSRFASKKKEGQIDMCKAIEDWYNESIELGMKRGLAEGLEKGLEQGLTQGLEQGLEQGLTQGLEQGLTQGLEQGRSEGRRQGKSLIILEMIKNGLSLDDIARFTSMPKEEIETLLHS